ncbi:hypothetical protein HanPSC8_Chr01g0005681 [Helianthus annuus]|nr:hypothetical protein HanPSC8_Chr01g0005681 [Helianthus annuus]
MICSKNGVFTRLNYFIHRSTKYKVIYITTFGKITSSCNNATLHTSLQDRCVKLV